MIKNRNILEKFNRELIEKEKLSHSQALGIYEALHKEAIGLGVISSKNILEGLETDIRIAKALNALKS